MTPNPSLNHRTRYGKRRKPGPRHLVHHREPGFPFTSERAAGANYTANFASPKTLLERLTYGLS